MEFVFGFYFDEVGVVGSVVGSFGSELVDQALWGDGAKDAVLVVVAHGSAELLEGHVVVLLLDAPQFCHFVWLHESVDGEME